MNNTIPPADPAEILTYLNQITNRRFRENKTNLNGIARVMKEGFTEQEIHEVIQIKTLEWKNNPEMSVHLNPITLFRPKNFEKYINQVIAIKENPQLYAKHFAKINKTTAGRSAADDTDAINDLYG